MNIIEAMEQRTSVRVYKSDKIARSILNTILEAGERAAPVSDAQLIFRLDYEGTAVEQGMGGVLGDYGKIITAPHYAVIAGYESTRYLLEAGYRFEQLILEAARQGLGSCWIGGMFREDKIKQVLDLPQNSKVIAITPLGLPLHDGIKGILGRVVRSAIGSTKRKPLDEMFFWETTGTPLPREILNNRFIMRWLEAVRRAPSWANKQPWLFLLRNDRIVLYKFDRQMKEGKDYHLVDCGIAMAHMHLAAQALGFPGHWDLSVADDPNIPPKGEAIACYVMEKTVIS